MAPGTVCEGVDPVPGADDPGTTPLPSDPVPVGVAVCGDVLFAGMLVAGLALVLCRRRDHARPADHSPKHRRSS